MQTLSDMRRSRFDLQPLVDLALFGAALIYETLTSITPYITPLLGVGFFYWRRHLHEKRYYFRIALFFLYTLYFEIDRDMILGSFILLAILYHYLVAQRLESAFNCPLCIPLFYVLYTYGGYYLLNLFLAFLFNLPLPAADMAYPVYMLSDLFILVLLT